MALNLLCLQLIRESGTNILEPIMYMEIAMPEEYMPTVMADLARRRPDIQNVTLRGTMKVSTVLLLNYC